MANDAISTLNDLIQTCRDGEKGFKTAAEHLKDTHVRSVFQELSRERGTLADELEREVGRLGGTAPTSGSVSGALHRGWLDLKSAATSGDGPIISEAERGEDVAKHAFESALAETAGMQPQTRAVVQRVADRVIAAHDRVRALEESRS